MLDDKNSHNLDVYIVKVKYSKCKKMILLPDFSLCIVRHVSSLLTWDYPLYPTLQFTFFFF